MRTIAIFNLKGGTAKTTTCRNMATILATMYNKRVLLCDLDESGNLSSSFGLRPSDDVDAGMTIILRDMNCNPRDHIKATNVENVEIIPCNETISTFEQELKDDENAVQQVRLKRQLSKVRNEYDFCLIDCPPHTTMGAINALVSAQEVIVPSTINQDSLDAVVRALYKITENQVFNPGLALRGVLFTKITNNGVDKEGIELDLGPHFNRFNTYIRHSVEVERSRFQNLSLREYMRVFRRKKFSPMLDYENFVAEYLGVEPPHPKEPYLKNKMFNLNISED